ncbi:MAG: AgmX/PglI C-terminal domain-containing protein [Myxococcota bacterium]
MRWLCCAAVLLALLPGARAAAPEPDGGSAPARSADMDGGVGGAIDKESVRRVVRSGFGGVRRCYEEYLTRTGLDFPDGKLVIDFVIGVDGRVTSAELHESSSLRDERLASCVLAVFRGLRFVKPVGGPVHVTYPFVFKSAE